MCSAKLRVVSNLCARVFLEIHGDGETKHIYIYICIYIYTRCAYGAFLEQSEKEQSSVDEKSDCER